MGDIIENSTNVVIGILISVILICSALIPIVIDQIQSLSAIEDYDSSTISTWTNLLEIVIVMVIIGLVIGVVRTYTKREYD